MLQKKEAPLKIKLIEVTHMSSVSIVIDRLCFRSLWKLNCVVVSIGMMLLGLIIGTYAWISGADVISINDQYVYGFTAFAASIAIMFLFSFVFGTLWTFVQWLGFIIYSRFRPMRLRYYELK